MTLLITQIIAQILSLQLYQSKLIHQAMIFLVLETTQVVSKERETF